MKRIQRALFTGLLLLPVVSAHSQNGINSPYSRYGFGVMSDRSLGFNKGMSGVAQGFRNGLETNVSNPASYSATDSLTALIDFGLSFQNGNYKMGNLQKNAKNTSIDYFTFQFRAFKNLGMSFGILPYTNINYNFTSNTENVTGAENITSSYEFSGSGGLHQVYFGAGWKIFGSPLSIGANISYLYGDYNHTSKIAYNQQSVYSMTRSYTADISTWKLDAGLQYTIKLSKTDDLTLGATYGYGHNINNRAIRTTQTTASTTIQGTTSDTIHNAFALPHSLDAGFTYQHGRKWRLGGDFGIEKWSDCKFPSQDNSEGTYLSRKGQLYDRMNAGLGFDITPNYQSKKLFNRMTYKLGGYYSRSYACADPTGTITDKPYEFGVSAGVTIPISNRNVWFGHTPKLNFAVQWVHTNIPYLNTTTFKKSTLEENYLKLSIGLTFSEHWFYKWKVQ